jgi:ROK family
MKCRNGALLLDLIRREGPVSHADLARRSGLTKPRGGKRPILAVHPERGAGRILEVIAKGIAAPGRVDPRQGVVLEAGYVFNWHDVAVREHLEKTLRLPVVVDNGMNLAALGEMHGGVAVGLRNFVLIR